MRIAVIFGPMCLSFRGSFDFDTLRSDPRGLTGSELGFVRIAQCLEELGHEVTVYTRAEQDEWDGVLVRPLETIGLLPHTEYDAAIAINEPDPLRGISAKVKVCEAWLNDWTWCRPGFDEHVDLFVSPSPGHLEQVLTNPDWRAVGVSGQHPRGAAVYNPDPEQWMVNELGCDPERYEGHGPKVPGRVVYCSSPDRGLHWLLQEWPRIKRAVPHATLRIFYRLRAWIDGFNRVAYHPPIENLRSRALYVEEALRRMSGPEWGITVCDSVSREQIEREMAEAEVLAYPCDTTAWSEGFSVTILEACAAKACPIISTCDALPSVYGEHLPMRNVRDSVGLSEWRDLIIDALSSRETRALVNAHAQSLASKLTWKAHAKKLETAIVERLEKHV